MRKAKNNSINRVLEATNSQELLAGYKDWAGDYDEDLNELGYVAPLGTVQMLMRLLENKDALILDAGCGTGLVGELLNKAGYVSIDALDYSQEMLDQAEEKDVYNSLLCADMNQTLDIPDNTYDAVTCVGAFTYGHVTSEAFHEIIRIIKPGGLFCFTVRDEVFHEQDYRKHMLELEWKGTWELQELRHEDYIVKENTCCKLAAYRILT